ncbi:probable ADP-ribosylation factor GTPase-activating protein AGD14 isoform X4 [Manihot esculenta]|uniref:probable ADP-ribosylation factor GTPase-activating protein AGD14 isoform X4 n=1 Tax=Manihot esculenta TaxID=3983 RepID=UPI001CC3C1B0|nr:probable ADP-ribosylation factor GTPase-activating protein AGD14 isoform X4 [Manihot esculenta]
MASRVKEDEKNERIIRGLLKLPENRRCINCNGLVLLQFFAVIEIQGFEVLLQFFAVIEIQGFEGPQYVCTNFWTFVCTNCSGIHREFTHRVKSVSMAKFNSQEVIALQGGGNKRARDIYLKEWDPQHHSAPDGSNADRLRDFIKHVYVDRRYTGERNCGKPSGLKLGDKEDLYQGGSRSPPYGDTYERRHSEMSSPGGRSDDRNSRYGYDERSPGYDQENRRYNGYETSPARAEMVNDWRREDRFGNGKRADDCRASDGDSKMERRSPERLKDPGASSPPIVRPVREILGDNVVPLRISEPPKTNSVRAANGSALTQRTASSSSLGSNYGNLTEVKVESAASLIDFDADPEQPITTAVPQAQQTIVSQSIAQPASATNDNNWASFDFAPEVKVSQASSNANPLESVLSQLSVPASVPGHISGMPSGTGAPVSVVNAVNLPSTTALPTAPAGNAHILPTCAIMFHPGGVSEAAPGLASVIPVNGGTSFVKVSETGQWRPSVQHQQPLLFPSSSGQSTQQFTLPFDGASTNQPMPTFIQPSKSTNPFDLSEPSSVQGHTFPSMASLQGALPNMPPSSGLQHTSSLGAPSSAWTPSQSLPHPSALPSQPPSYAPAMPPRPYMGQVSSNMTLSGPQGVGGFGTEGGALGSINMDQQLAGRFTAPATSSPFSAVGGNPFG